MSDKIRLLVETWGTVIETHEIFVTEEEYDDMGNNSRDTIGYNSSVIEYISDDTLIEKSYKSIEYEVIKDAKWKEEAKINE